MVESFIGVSYYLNHYTSSLVVLKSFKSCRFLFTLLRRSYTAVLHSSNFFYDNRNQLFPIKHVGIKMAQLHTKCRYPNEYIYKRIEDGKMIR